MTKYDYDMGVIGGGAGGLTIASGSAQLDAKTLLIEKDHALGGDCLHFGCVPSKTLIKTAQVIHLAKNAEKFGLSSCMMGDVEFSNIAKHIQNVIEKKQKHDSVKRFNNMGVDIKFGQGRFIDPHTFEINGEKITSRYWAITTGSSPGIPQIDGLDKTEFITNRKIFSLKELPKTMIALGAGPISIEMANAFSMLGTKVTVIEKREQILTREDADMANMLMKSMKQQGVEFCLNCKIKSVSQQGSQKCVTFEHNEKEMTLKADVLLVAAGRTQNVEGLGLENAGIEYTSQGIVTDQQCRTTAKNIFAAGDIRGKYLFTHTAGYEGGIVVGNAILHIPRKMNYRWLPWCTYCHPELANVGMNVLRAKAAGLEYKIVKEEFKNNDRSIAEGSEEGMIKLVLDKKGKPLGVQILGLHAGEFISEWVCGLNANTKLSRIAGAIHPYPTLAEINKKVVSNYFAEKLFSPAVKKTLKLLFKYQG